MPVLLGEHPRMEEPDSQPLGLVYRSIPAGIDQGATFLTAPPNLDVDRSHWIARFMNVATAVAGLLDVHIIEERIGKMGAKAHVPQLLLDVLGKTQPPGWCFPKPIKIRFKSSPDAVAHSIPAKPHGATCHRANVRTLYGQSHPPTAADVAWCGAVCQPILGWNGWHELAITDRLVAFRAYPDLHRWCITSVLPVLDGCSEKPSPAEASASYTATDLLGRSEHAVSFIETEGYVQWFEDTCFVAAPVIGRIPNRGIFPSGCPAVFAHLAQFCPAGN